VPETALNAILPSTQGLVALVVLRWVEREPGLTEWDIESRFRGQVARRGRPLWRPSRGTISKVVRGLLEGGYLEGRWVDEDRTRRRPLSITPAGRQRTQVLLEQFRDPIDNARRYFAELHHECYETSR
jgi:DNA-binding PadR family transcriptional regulator